MQTRGLYILHSLPFKLNKIASLKNQKFKVNNEILLCKNTRYPIKCGTKANIFKVNNSKKMFLQNKKILTL